MASTPWIPDASALAEFRRNPEAFRLRYRLHLTPATPNDKTNAGSALHAALNEWFSETTESSMGAELALRAHYTSPTLVRPVEHMERVLRAYCARYPREGESFAVDATEEYVEAHIAPHNPSAGGFDYCGIIDRRIRFADGSRYVMDTKSTGEYLSKLFKTLALSNQMIGYVALLRARGERCDGFYVDGIHINDKTGKIDATKDFDRYGPQLVHDWQIARWARDVRWTLDQIAQLDAQRGPNEPWPLYTNWLYGKVDEYEEFYAAAPELHDSVAKLFARKEWSPRQVAASRRPT